MAVVAGLCAAPLLRESADDAGRLTAELRERHEHSAAGGAPPPYTTIAEALENTRYQMPKTSPGRRRTPSWWAG